MAGWQEGLGRRGWDGEPHTCPGPMRDAWLLRELKLAGMRAQQAEDARNAPEKKGSWAGRELSAASQGIGSAARPLPGEH